MDDWKPGDLALYIGDRPGAQRAPDECPRIISALAPVPGSTWTVDAVEMVYRPEEDRELIYLGLQGQPSRYLYDGRMFRKIAPHEPDAEDAETIELLTKKREPVQ